MYVVRAATLAVGCLLSLPVVAEQRFYQFIDAQGHVQTVEAPLAEPATPPQKSSVSPVEGRTESASPGHGSGVEMPPDAAPAPDSEQPEEEYVDSEVLERKDFNPSGKKRFYILEDGVGSRVEESSGPLTGTTPELAPPIGETSAEPRISLQDAVNEVIDPDEIRRLLGRTTLCADKKSMKSISTLSLGGAQSASVDLKTWHFLGKGGALIKVRIPGEGLRKLKVTSYSKASKKPEFFIPFIAFSNEAGCIVRMIADGYFEWQYGETKTRQARVEGSLIMSSEERYVFVMLPGSDSVNPAEKIVVRPGEFTIEYRK